MIVAQKKAWTDVNRKPKGPASAECCQKISDALKGRKLSDAHRLNMSKALKGRKRGNHPPEVIKKMSEARVRLMRLGKIRLGHYSKCGTFESAKNGKVIKFRSRLEEAWYKKLENDPLVKIYKPEPLSIQYEWNGSTHRYLPDLKVVYTNGRRELWEIKPEGDWARTPKERTKWSAARKWCREQTVEIYFRVKGYLELE